jgi:hypothetical protein
VSVMGCYRISGGFELSFLSVASSNAIWDRSVSSNHLYGVVSLNMIGELVCT